MPDWRAVLGLVEPKDADWGRVRAEQINVIQRLAPLRLAIHLLGVGGMVAALFRHTPHTYLFAWAGALVALILLSTVRKIGHSGWKYQTATLGEFHRETLWATALATGWGAAPILFGRYCDPSELMLVWVTVTSMMAAAAFGLSAAPLATSFYVFVLGAGLSTMAWMLHLPVVAAAGGLFALGLTGASLFAGRTFVIHEAAGLALAEKTEVVSLLLREFDDSGGDWMWQTDASKCLTHVSPRFAFALGVEPQSLETRPLLQILAGDAWEAGNFSAGLRDLAEKLKKRESFSDLILPVTIKNEVHWWELSASPRFDDRGSFLGFMGWGPMSPHSVAPPTRSTIWHASTR